MATLNISFTSKNDEPSNFDITYSPENITQAKMIEMHESGQTTHISSYQKHFSFDGSSIVIGVVLLVLAWKGIKKLTKKEKKIFS